MEDGGFLGSFGSFLFWFFAIFGGVVCLALLGVLVFVWLQIRVYLGLIDKVMAVTESGLRFVGVKTKLTKFRLFKMALKFLLSKKARANVLGGAKDFVVNRGFRRKKNGNGASPTTGLRQVAKRNEEVLLKMAYNEAVNFAKLEAGKVLSGEQIGLGDAKETALKSGGKLLRAARDEAVKEAVNFAKDEARRVLSGDAQERLVEEKQGEVKKAQENEAVKTPVEAPAKNSVKETENPEPENVVAEKVNGEAAKEFVNVSESKPKRALFGKLRGALKGKPTKKEGGNAARKEAAKAEMTKPAEAEGSSRKPAAKPAPKKQAGAAPESGKEANAAGGNRALLEKVCRGMERLLSQEPLDEAKLASVVKKLLSPNSGLKIPASEWAKWGKLAQQKGAYEIAATLLEKAAGEL